MDGGKDHNNINEGNYIGFTNDSIVSETVGDVFKSTLFPKVVWVLDKLLEDV